MMGHVDDGLQVIEQIIASYPNPPKIEKVYTKDCYYDLREDKLVLPENPLDDFQQTVHELVHSTGHPSRLNRLSSHITPKDREWGIEEIIADMGSLEFFSRLNMLQKQFYYNDKTTSIRWFFSERLNDRCKSYGVGIEEGERLQALAKQAVDYLFNDI